MTRVMSLVPIRLLRLAGLWAILTVFSATAAWAYWEGECEESGYFGEDEYYYGSETECWEEESGEAVTCPTTVIGTFTSGTTREFTLSNSRLVTETQTLEGKVLVKAEASCPLKRCSGGLEFNGTISKTRTVQTTYGLYQSKDGYWVEADCYDLSIERQGSNITTLK